MQVIDLYFPQYRSLSIHESSPGGRGVSVKLHYQCSDYSASHFYTGITPGEINPDSGYRCENLESLTFPDESFDLFVTQDVMEHIFNPQLAFSEIARVLKPGGAHIFTVPIVNKSQGSSRRASLDDAGVVVFHADPEYHGNPVDPEGSLVVMDWGYDIARFIYDEAHTPTNIISIDNIDQGIRAEFIDVLVSFKAREAKV